MSVDLWYPGAEHDPQQDGGSLTAGPYRGVLHTTESGGYPSYRPGTHPHFTIWLDNGRGRVRQHVPLDRASRALRNDAGGVETNRLSAVQFEIAWYAVHAPTMPPALLDTVRAVMRWVEAQTGIRRAAPRFEAYPASYGVSNGVRMTGAQWTGFDGWCGHQHVPENDHGDPGLIDIAYLLGASPAAPEDDLTPDQAKTLDDTHAQVAALRKEMTGRYGADTDRFAYLAGRLGALMSSDTRLERVIAQVAATVGTADPAKFAAQVAAELAKGVNLDVSVTPKEQP